MFTLCENKHVSKKEEATMFDANSFSTVGIKRRHDRASRDIAVW